MTARRNRTGIQRNVEIDLHGLSAEQAEARILSALSNSSTEAGMQIRFVHGKGLGILADLVHRIGKRDSRVASVEKSFFNPGVTSYVLSGRKENHSETRAQTCDNWGQRPPPVRKKKQ